MAIVAALALAACGEATKPPLPGERVAVLTASTGLAPTGDDGNADGDGDGDGDSSGAGAGNTNEGGQAPGPDPA
ncbi:MAG: hypothetical protein ACK5YI_09750, partial [Rhodospirillales bacterium]